MSARTHLNPYGYDELAACELLKFQSAPAFYGSRGCIHCGRSFVPRLPGLVTVPGKEEFRVHFIVPVVQPVAHPRQAVGLNRGEVVALTDVVGQIVQMDTAVLVALH